MGKRWNLKRTVQCAKCPWRTDCDPSQIPNGYSRDKHCNLKGTIAEPGDLTKIGDVNIRVMACHEDHVAHCIGWLFNQLGPGNNIPLRLHMMSCDNFKAVRTVGRQHKTFEDTIPDDNR